MSNEVIAKVDKKDSMIWEFVPLDSFQVPSPPVAYAAKKGVELLRNLLRRDEPEPESPFKPEDDLRALPEWQLERLVPVVEWQDAADALTTELKDWLSQGNPSPPTIVLVGPPHSGYADLLKVWARQQEWSVIEPPTTEQILAKDDRWFSEQCEGDTPWVLPTLEKAYLRHESGLGLLRRFLDHAHSGGLGHGILGCDSWAWAFLRHVWHGRQSLTLSLQAFDEGRLIEFFHQEACSRAKENLLFRQSDNGHYVLPPPDPEQNPGEMSTYIKLLAAHSRGNLGVARAVWRKSLLATPDELLPEEPEGEEPAFPGHTIWVSAWDQIKHPTLPSGAGRDEAFVLHAILLHGGMPDDVLRQLVPLSPTQVMETLSRLEEAEIVSDEGGAWHVPPLGYPAARRFLQIGGYLVDRC